ncbi:host attachment protein [Jiella marina]|uniref:host attachment protein n=1 Tax=Jiella sp. LLJ827 TaxID=2917712 RepID=UPI002100A951|nr:host attachment protein [Jiella sp. LLJ827]MCQ0989327.1 host attachment protein [Jiella sp. LLJ827]
METMRIWVLVADPMRARIVRDAMSQLSDGPAELVLRARNRRVRSVMMDSAVSRAVAETSETSAEASRLLLEEDVENFACMLVDILESHYRAGEFDRFAIVAVAPFMDILRSMLTASLRSVLLAAIVRDLTRLPAAELRATTKQILAEMP